MFSIEANESQTSPKYSTKAWIWSSVSICLLLDLSQKFLTQVGSLPVLNALGYIFIHLCNYRSIFIAHTKQPKQHTGRENHAAAAQADNQKYDPTRSLDFQDARPDPRTTDPRPLTLDPDRLWAHQVCLTLSFTPFGRSSSVTPKNPKQITEKYKKLHQNNSQRNPKNFTEIYKTFY